VEPKTVRDELYDLEVERFALVRKLDVLITDSVKPLRKEIELYDKRILAVITENGDQAVMDFGGGV